MLYLIKEYGKNNKEYLKIGKADNVSKRMQQYNTSCTEFELIDTFEGSISEETLLHSFLEKYKVKGEWMEYNEEILLLWKLYKELRPKIKENILTTGEYIKKEFYDTQLDYYKNKIEDLEETTSNFYTLYLESLSLFQFTFKIIPTEYRNQVKEKFNGKLQYFKFKEEI